MLNVFIRLIAKVAIERLFVYSITNDLVDQSESKVAIYNWQIEQQFFDQTVLGVDERSMNATTVFHSFW